MQLKQTVAPLVDPVSLVRVKEFLCNEYDTEDVVINGFIQAATNACERFLARSLITQTWTMYIDGYPTEIHLPRNPVQSITSVTSYVQDGTTVVNPSTDYFLVDTDQRSTATLNYNQTWDSSILRPRNGVEVIYVAGYGDDPDDIPAGITQGLLLLIEFFYKNYDTNVSADDKLTEIPESIATLWQPYKVVHV